MENNKLQQLLKGKFSNKFKLDEEGKNVIYIEAKYLLDIMKTLKKSITKAAKEQNKNKNDE